MNNKVIIFGDDCVNSLGLVQSLGREGVETIAVLKCRRSTLVKASKYAGEIICIADYSEAIDMLLSRFQKENNVLIIPSGDGPALTLEKYKDCLSKNFIFEGIIKKGTLSHYMRKDNQIALAKKHGFNIPVSIKIKRGDIIADNIPLPCIIKPLISCEGDKRDIRILDKIEDVRNHINHNLQFTEEVIIQQFIEKDYEYDMMGCSFTNGEVYIPLSDRMVKFNHKLAETSTVSYIEPLDPEIQLEVDKIERLMKDIGFVGLFSVEFMHNKKDNKIYFTEINFRNDGENSFIVHGGVNLPYLHYCDMMGHPLKEYNPIKESKKYIWEGVHFSGLIQGDESFIDWIKDLCGCDGFLYYFKDDRKPFFAQFYNKIKSKLHL